MHLPAHAPLYLTHPAAQFSPIPVSASHQVTDYLIRATIVYVGAPSPHNKNFRFISQLTASKKNASRSQPPSS
uniref:Uncharacterized protein n=1 Tax=Triticum urartu TaxID=4572 RepID=A0A8R7QKN7_TRIUA